MAFHILDSRESAIQVMTITEQTEGRKMELMDHRHLLRAKTQEQIDSQGDSRIPGMRKSSSKDNLTRGILEERENV